MDYFTIITSIVTIFVTFIVTKWQIIHDRKMNLLNLENEYFREIFQSFIVEKIPIARNKVTILENGKITGKAELIAELHNIMKGSLYYKYIDYKFYDDLCYKIQCLEDFLIVPDESDNKYVVENFIDCYIEDIYKCLSDQYSGKKNR